MIYLSTFQLSKKQKKNTNIYPLSSVRGCVPSDSIYKNKNEVIYKK